MNQVFTLREASSAHKRDSYESDTASSSPCGTRGTGGRGNPFQGLSATKQWQDAACLVHLSLFVSLAPAGATLGFSRCAQTRLIRAAAAVQLRPLAGLSEQSVARRRWSCNVPGRRLDSERLSSCHGRLQDDVRSFDGDVDGPSPETLQGGDGQEILEAVTPGYQQEYISLRASLSRPVSLMKTCPYRSRQISIELVSEFFSEFVRVFKGYPDEPNETRGRLQLGPKCYRGSSERLLESSQYQAPPGRWL
ncbi:unnamed protein product [Pleuronectes platessa]|uniref:Uncharacterized protein n=1 Tax=Pleuronectes platessa TaxID=8262 RepID=A0A9N7Z1J3_PLEPL|nr:unnamed protein product [Pleuronectes platessa]